MGDVVAFPATLLKAAYPAILIERWTSSNGWDKCFRVFIVTPGHYINVCGDEHATYAEAYAVAAEYASQQLPNVLAILDMTVERGA